jgi:hypothetical protein
MPDREKVFDAIRNCITEPKCRDCPWDECEKFDCKKVSVPVSLLLDALKLLKEQEAVEPILKRKGKSKMYNDYVCPICDNNVVYEQCYCSECGKPFLWEGR